VIQAVRQSNSKPVQAGAVRPVLSGPVDLLNGNVEFEHARQELNLQENTNCLIPPMLHSTKLGYIDHNLIERRSNSELAIQKI
jgi:hypothetical protein